MATLAARVPRAERIIVPALDILQSVPILGFLSVTVTGFIALFPGSMLGLEAASIFAIFTSQGVEHDARLLRVAQESAA